MGQVPLAAGNPQRFATASILGLQRTVGNNAVGRLLAEARQGQPDRQDSRASMLPKAPSGGPVVQRKMAYTYKQFKKDTDQDKNIKAAKTAKKSLNLTDEREAELQQKHGQWTDVGINESFKVYEKTETLQDLIKLQDSILYWRSFNVLPLQKPESLESALWLRLEKVLRHIQYETREQLGKEWKGEDDIEAAKLLGTEETTSANAEKLPAFVQEVGIAPAYYKDHLKGKPALAMLEELYNNLSQGDLLKADLSLDILELQALPGFPLIRSLFLSHFSNAAQLGDFVGTEHQTGELTEDEKTALNLYVSSSIAINKTMRNIDLNPENLGKASPHKALVSALTKLPPYQGLAYRGQSPFNGMAEVWQPGGVIADLSFVSAASSMAGAEFYLNKTADIAGGKNIYSILKVKTASNLAGISTIPQETEVLFRPGARFRINAIWQHVNGKVPPNAPHAVKSVLLRVGEFKTDDGRDEINWAAFRQEKITERNIDHGEFKDQKQVQVKVFELEEI